MYRVHATDVGSIVVQLGTEAECEEHLGYEKDDAKNAHVLVLNDSGNQEAWVVHGDPEQWRGLAQSILDVIDETKERGDQ